MKTSNKVFHIYCIACSKN